jgi:stage III sporulation protein SpoIIIAA
MNVDEDLDKLLETLPSFLKNHLTTHKSKDKIIEIVMDVGRRPEARFTTGPEYLSHKIISWQDLEYIIKRLSNFSNDNRAGIERTLHRISCIRNRQFLITGLTCRVGRAVFGSIGLVRDLLESGKSILILGKPGVGKTTIIREIARVLSDEMEKRVVIVDTSNEIAGDSDIPHPGIGRARRMQVAQTDLQHQVMIEAVENHMPEVIIIDEIGTELEALAARTIAEKGVQLVGTTHGNCLENVIKNPPLTDLIGGIQYVTLSDEEAKRRKTQKSILERKGYPAFQIAIEVNEQNCWTIHENVQDSVDLILRGNFSIAQFRTIRENEKIIIRYKPLEINPFFPSFIQSSNSLFKINQNWSYFNKQRNLSVYSVNEKRFVIYSYSISYNLLREVVLKLNIPITLTKDLTKANFIIGLKKQLYQNQKLQSIAKQNNIPIYGINRNCIYQITKLFQFLSS